MEKNIKQRSNIPIKKNIEAIKEKQPETSPIAAGSGQFSLFDQAKEDKTNEKSSTYWICTSIDGRS